MSNIVQFPPPADRSWSNYEAFLLKLFADSGIPESVQERVLDRVREAFKVTQVPLSLQVIDPDQLSEPLRTMHLESLEQIRTQYARVMADIVTERVVAEIRFCRELGILL